jgi:polysaccharide biosynthesis protein PslJ
MDLNESFEIWRRRWILATALLILALTGAAAALMGFPRTYQSSSSVVMLASRAAAKLNGGNPYLSFSPSLTLTADALSREMMAPPTIQSLAARGFTDSYTVALAPYTTTTTGSVLLVTVTGSDRNAAENTLYGVTQEISAQLARLQTKVTRNDQIRAATLSFTPEPTLSVSQTARALVPVIAPGLLLALGIPVILDGQLTRRRFRTAMMPAEADQGPADQLVDSGHALADQQREPG